MSKRILIIDDEVSFTRLMSMNLEDTGDFEVKIENDPLKATQTAKYFKPDMVILDILMPGKSGLQLATEWESSEELAALPILFLTAAMSKDQPDVENELLIKHQVLIKPVSFTQLVDTIRQVLKK